MKTSSASAPREAKADSVGRVVAIVQARMRSSRLPGKVLLDLGGTRRALLLPAAADPACAEPLLELDGGAVLRVRVQPSDPTAPSTTVAVAMLPAPAGAVTPVGGGSGPVPGVADGAFTSYALPVPPVPAVAVAVAPVRNATLPPPPAKGSRGWAVG